MITARFTALLPLVLMSTAAAQHTQTWARQPGTPTGDVVGAVAPHAGGGAFVGGGSAGTPWGPTAGGTDAVLALYNPDGSLAWGRAFGGPGSDQYLTLAPDGMGGVYAAGMFESAPGAGGHDLLIARWDSGGTRLWSRQFGSPLPEAVTGVLGRAWGGYMISGNTGGPLMGSIIGSQDFFLAEYGDNGSVTWSRQLGTAAYDMAAALVEEPGGDIYIVGTTDGALGGPSAGQSDAFVARYDHWGNAVWVRQFGGPDTDSAYAACPDGAGGVILVGVTGNSLGGPLAGPLDAFAARYSPAGVRVWLRQYGSPGMDRWNGIVRTPAGGLFVTGITSGTWGGPIGGIMDGVLSELSPGGDLLWTKQLGTPGWDEGRAITFGPAGAVYLGLATSGPFAGPPAGSEDIVIARFDAACYPDCNVDGSLNLADFGCFQTRFAPMDPYADCNADGSLNLADFGCFQTRFALGCP